MKVNKCPFCEKKYSQKPSLYDHMEREHINLLKENSTKIEMSPSQVYFNFKNNYLLYKKNGKCIICGKDTKWNDHTEKYNRLCSNPICAEKYREEFKNRMLKSHGKIHLLNDPEMQKKMLASRKISGEIKFKNKTFTYTGNLELEFLKFILHGLEWNVDDLIMPAPQIFRYEYEKTEHFHIPDVYIPTLKLIINIKSSENKHYRLRDIEQEKAIDSIIEKSKYGYLKLFDGNHDPFIKYLEGKKKLNA